MLRLLLVGCIGGGVILLLVACGGGGEDSGNDGNGADATEPTDGGSPESGSATVTRGDESWSFGDVVCTFTQEESGDDRVLFSLSAFGETAEGARVQLDADIQDPDEDGRYKGDGVTYAVSVNDVDRENSTVGWTLLWISSPEADPRIQVDGKNVTADLTTMEERTFGNFEKVPGTLRGTCP